MARSTNGETYRDVLAVRDFRYMWLAEIISTAGDQLTRIALSVLVYTQTQSAAFSGLVYGLTFLPTLLGSVFLTGFADHYPRRTVMYVCNGARAVLTALVAVPGIPLWLLCILIASSTAVIGPFRAAEQALIPDLLSGRLYILGMSLRTSSSQIAQLAGFAIGGTLIYLLSPIGALLFDAGTFLVAMLLVLCTIARPVQPTSGEHALSLRGMARGFTAFWADKRLLVLLSTLALNLFHIIPEGIAPVFVTELHQGSWTVALVQASAPLGAALGVFIFGRFVPDPMQPKLFGPAAIGASVALIPLFAPIGLVISLVCFAVAGAFSAVYTMYAAALITQLAPESDRGRVVGVNIAVLQTANGLGPTVGGAVAGALTASAAIAFAGIVSAALAVAIAITWLLALRSKPLTTTT